ncbi:hypothetical protein Leryth_005808 [Lithospermum erythrorhizon]|nr:hypothetical protein Leryth_005808 [Lithospermum erythrorhizon]
MDAIEYIKFLEEEKKSLEDLKKMKEMGAKSKPLLSECSSNRSACASSVNVSVSNGVAFFGIELPSKRGLVTEVFRVFERYQAEVLAANIGTNDHQFLRLSATVLLENIGGDCIEKIKREMLSL